VSRARFDWDNYPEVDLRFWVKKPFDARETASAFLEMLEGHGYRPDRIDVGWERSRFVPLQEHMDKYYSGWLELAPKAVSTDGMLRRTSRPRGSMSCSVSADGRLPFDFLAIELEEEHFREEAHQRGFVQMARELYDLLSPAYGLLEQGGTWLGRTGMIDLESGLPGVLWGNFLGPEYSEMLGWGKLEGLGRELPVEVERLADGGVLILLGGSVLDSGSAEMLALAEAVEGYLGQEYLWKMPPSWPPKRLPFSFADIEAGRVPREELRKVLMPPKPPQGVVPAFRYEELRRERAEAWERSGGMTVEELAEDLGVELKGPGGVIMVEAETGRGIDVPGAMLEEGAEEEEVEEDEEEGDG
jgi:hypothetical protein